MGVEAMASMELEGKQRGTVDRAIIITRRMENADISDVISSTPSSNVYPGPDPRGWVVSFMQMFTIWSQTKLTSAIHARTSYKAKERGKKT